MISRMVHTTPFRLVALVLAAVLMVLASTPGKAEAVDALTIIAIAGLVVAGIVLIASLVVANVEGRKRADIPRVLWMACLGDECGSVPAENVAAIAAEMPLAERQGP